MEGIWATLSAATPVRPRPAANGFEFLDDPMALVDPDDRRRLAEGLSQLDRLRRDVESEGVTLRMA